MLERAKQSKDLAGIHDLLNKWRHTAYLEMRNPGSYYRMLWPRCPPRRSTQLATEPVRTFASAGTLSTEPDLPERVEEILGTEPGYCCHPA